MRQLHVHSTLNVQMYKFCTLHDGVTATLYVFTMHDDGVTATPYTRIIYLHTTPNS